MTQEEILKSKTEYLFGCSFEDPTFDDEDSAHRDVAESLITEYGWNMVFSFWFDFLKTQCKTEKDVFNFANLFFYYGGTEQALRDPYPFVSYFYYRVDTRKFGGEATDIFDSIAIPMLSRIGDVSLENHPDYVPEKDEKILAAVEKWKDGSMTSTMRAPS